MFSRKIPLLVILFFVITTNIPNLSASSLDKKISKENIKDRKRPLLLIKKVYIHNRTQTVHIVIAAKEKFSVNDMKGGMLHMGLEAEKILLTWPVSQLSKKSKVFPNSIDFDSGKKLSSRSQVKIWISGVPNNGLWKGTIGLDLEKKRASKLDIKKVYISSSTRRLHVELKNLEQNEFSKQVYKKAKLHISAQHETKKWTWPLEKVDPKFTSFIQGVDFNTGKVLKETAKLKVWLSGIASQKVWVGTLEVKRPDEKKLKGKPDQGSSRQRLPERVNGDTLDSNLNTNNHSSQESTPVSTPGTDEPLGEEGYCCVDGDLQISYRAACEQRGLQWAPASNIQTQGLCCADKDGDGYGSSLDCAGPDCNERSPMHWDDCGSCIDEDNDGYGQDCSLGNDCNDANENIYPGAELRCNGEDNNCDGEIDSQIPCFPYPDMYRGIGDCQEGFRQCINGIENPTCEGFVRPGTESCGGGDEDCDGQVDEEGSQGCTLYRKDEDGDGYGVMDVKCLCEPEAPYTVLNQGWLDCDDTRPEVFPGAIERCNTPYRDDCGLQGENRQGTEGCTSYYQDVDGDGYGNSLREYCLCGPDLENNFTATQGGDCNDNDPSIHPSAHDICNGVDDNCDIRIDNYDGTLVELCGSLPPNAAEYGCGGERGCTIFRCNERYWNLDDDYNNGCETREDLYDRLDRGDTCTDAVYLGEIRDIGTINVTSNIVPTGESDYFRLRVFDSMRRADEPKRSPSGREYYDWNPNIRIKFRLERHVSDFRFDIFERACGDSHLIRSSAVYPWETTVVPYIEGGAYGNRTHSETYYIKIYRPSISAITPLGQDYTFTIETENIITDREADVPVDREEVLGPRMNAPH